MEDFQLGMQRVVAATQAILNTGLKVIRNSNPNKEFIAYINFNKENYSE